MFRLSLFWRTFVLMAGLVLSSQAALLLVLSVFDSAPPEQRVAWEVASAVNLTRSALVSSQPERRITLLRELANEEGIRVLPLEPGDEIELTALTGRIALLAPRLQNLLGPETTVVSRVNGEEGLWVSFDIDKDKYWLQMQGRRIDRHFGPDLTLVLAIAGTLALVGSFLLSRLVNRPLADLTGAINAMRRGETPERLKEDVASEIAEVNQRFNGMAADLAALEQDRAIALAGISHDIRSPLARLRMEAEMALLDPDTRDSMVEDIGRIDTIVGRFVDFARIGGASPAAQVPVAEVLQQLPQVYRPQIVARELELKIDVQSSVSWIGDRTDLERALSNLIDNAVRYGRTRSGDDDTPEAAQVTVRAYRQGARVTIEVSDLGPGVQPEQLESLLHPFARGDSSRGGADGTGLGLAIVDRFARRYDGNFTLNHVVPTGLRALLVLPDARTSRESTRSGVTGRHGAHRT